MNSVQHALAEGARRLAPSSDTPRLDCELLMAAALEIERDTLLLNPPAGAAPETFWSMVQRRSAGEPIAYITGRRAFWNIDLEVGPGVLIPRPDSEVLIATALEHFGDGSGPRRILDLGTGPGTLLLAALDIWPAATGLGIDTSATALAFARRNAVRLGLSGRVEVRQGNWAQGIDERFDLLLCNPPYVADSGELGPGVADFEPPEALFAGGSGLEAYEALAPQLPGLLAKGGLAVVEIGFDQGDSALAILRRSGLKAELRFDLGGRARAVALTRV